MTKVVKCLSAAVVLGAGVLLSGAASAAPLSVNGAKAAAVAVQSGLSGDQVMERRGRGADDGAGHVRRGRGRD